MFNKKLKKELQELKEYLQLNKSQSLVPDIKCSKCKCWGLKTDFFKVTTQEKPYISMYYRSDGISYQYYCLRCKPNYDYIDLQNKEPIYYKTVAEHREKIKPIIS